MGRATSRFSHWSHGGWSYHRCGLDQPMEQDSMFLRRWSSWREREGQLCRTHADCNWLDSSLRVRATTIP